MTIKSELLQLKAESSDGLLHAHDAVAWARQHPESKLHSALEWDDPQAAESWRIWQVRQLIQLHVVSEDGVPQMISLSIDRKSEGGYRDISDVVKNKNLSDIMLADALAELERVQTRYARIKELVSVWEQVETVKRRTRRRMTEQPQVAAG